MCRLTGVCRTTTQRLSHNSVSTLHRSDDTRVSTLHCPARQSHGTRRQRHTRCHVYVIHRVTSPLRAAITHDVMQYRAHHDDVELRHITPCDVTITYSIHS